MPPPDANLYPVATSLAKELVDKHKDPRERSEVELTLGYAHLCQNLSNCMQAGSVRSVFHLINPNTPRIKTECLVQRVWTVLEEKSIPYQYIEVNPYHKPESLLKLNPRGLVPTLEFDNKPLYESTVVCEFLDDQYPKHGAQLLPTNAFEKAQMRLWIDFVTTRVIRSFHQFLQFQSGEAEGTIDDIRQTYLGNLKELTKQMDPGGPFFTGKEPLLIDFIVAPWALRNWVFDHFKGGLGIPAEGEGGADEQTWARWRRWMAAISERRSLRETTSEKEYYLPIYQRYADNTAQSELAKATRAGKGVP